MNILLDTNILIPLEPTGITELAQNAERASTLFREALAAGHKLFRHPLTHLDIARDRNHERAQILKARISKYPELPDPPRVSTQLLQLFGPAEPGTNDWVDNHMLASLEANAVAFLVTEDKGIRAKARRAGFGDRVLTLIEALTILVRPTAAPPPPAVKAVMAHALQPGDPIFDSFRTDYPGFNEWLATTQREHRQAWKIDAGNNRLAAVCIVKEETDNKYHTGPKTLKICSFKVGHDFGGYRYGELMLKAIFQHAHAHRHTGLYVTVFEKHEALVELMDDFGFQRHPTRTHRGELVLCKSLIPDASATEQGLQFHIKYGPPAFDTRAPWHIVPIQPKFSDILFPETTHNKTLFEGQLAFGNAIRKAYLCHSPSHKNRPGDVLAFYRTQDHQGIIAIGIVEDSFRSRDPDIIASAVAKRTVYTRDEIVRMCSGEVLILLFRQCRLVVPRLDANTLSSAGVFRRAPQSIMKISDPRGLEWITLKFAA